MATPEATPEPTPTETPEPSYDFPTGEAVTVTRQDLSPNRVDSTGAWLPVNGKPTFVVVDDPG